MNAKAGSLVLVGVVFAMACGSQQTARTTCDDDFRCPYQQCCVAGACVDPGPVGSCATPGLGESTLTVAPQTVVAGTTADVTIMLRDVYGRPITGTTASVLVQSGCIGCEQVVSSDWTSNALGLVHGTFSSTVAGDKTLLLRVESQLGEPVMLHVVPDVAVSVGFAAAIADTRVDQPLSQVAVTRLDAFGNPDALPAPGDPAAVDVEVQIDVNPADLVLVDQAGTELDQIARTVHLDQLRVKVDGLYVSLVAHGLRLSAADVSEVPQLAATVSNDFSMTTPLFTSAMPDQLTSPAGGAVSLTWSAAPGVAAQVHEGLLITPAMTSPAGYSPAFASETPNLAHVVIEPAFASLARDVEVSRLADAKTFTPSVRNNSSVTITDLDVFSDGDVLVTGTFNFDVRLGERDGVGVVATSVAAGGLEGFVARFDPTLRELRWYVLYYGASSAAKGVNVSVRDSVVFGSKGVLLLAEFQGAFAGWRFDAVNGASTTVTQCVAKGSGNDTLFSATVARLDGATGEVLGCAGLYDSNADPAQRVSVRAGAAATLGSQLFAAVRVTKSYVVAPGVMVAAPGIPASIPTGPTPAAVTVTVPAAEPTCTSGVVALTPVTSAGTLDTTVPVLITSISFEPERLIGEGTSDLLLGGNGCSAGTTNPIEVGGAEYVTTVRADAMVLRVDFPPSGAPTPGMTMHMVWQSHGPNLDRLLDVQRLGGADLVVLGDFAISVPTPGGSLAAPAGLFSGYVARVSRASGAMQWAHQLNGATSSVTPRSLAVSGDRLTVVATTFDSLQLDATPHQIIDMNDNLPDPVGLVLELAPSGNVRWSSLLLGSSTPSRPLALSRGRVALALNGLQGALVLGALDAAPARQTNQRGGRTEPVVGMLTPYDFVARDILRN